MKLIEANWWMTLTREKISLTPKNPAAFWSKTDRTFIA